MLEAGKLRHRITILQPRIENRIPIPGRWKRYGYTGTFGRVGTVFNKGFSRGNHSESNIVPGNYPVSH